LESLEQWRNNNKTQGKIVNVPHPFIKWVGGKRQLISQLIPFIPKAFNNYIEPFVGGGALYFYLLPEKSILIDNNPELINCYNVIRNNVEDLIQSLKKHKNEKEYFYQVRDLDRDINNFEKMNDIEKASRTIFLNKTCYNGLYRVNSKNQFNTPFGRYDNPTICDDENLRAVSIVLKGSKILLDDFEKVLNFAEKDDFIYFDSPYDPLSQTANFTSYTKDNFGKIEQERLNAVFIKLDKKKCKILLSNAYTDFIKELYKDYTIHTLYANRAVNSDATKRGKIKEILISNF
jgi:DNA adenine methylase